MGDIEFARRFGAPPILVLTGDGTNTQKRPEFQALENSAIFDNLAEAVQTILNS